MIQHRFGAEAGRRGREAALVVEKGVAGENVGIGQVLAVHIGLSPGDASAEVFGRGRAIGGKRMAGAGQIGFAQGGAGDVVLDQQPPGEIPRSVLPERGAEDARAEGAVRPPAGREEIDVVRLVECRNRCRCAALRYATLRASLPGLLLPERRA